MPANAKKSLVSTTFLSVETKREAVSVGYTEFRDPTLSPGGSGQCQHGNRLGVASRTKFLLLTFPAADPCPEPPLQGRFSPCQGKGPFLGQGGSWLSQFSHLFSPCPSPAAFLSQDRLYLTGKHRGRQEGMGEAKVNNGRH